MRATDADDPLRTADPAAAAGATLPGEDTSSPPAGQAGTTRVPPDQASEWGDGPQAAPLPTVPGYEVLGELGRGGMGVVYKARHEALDRVVALKVLRAGPHADADELRRFRHEAQAAARLQHPHIVQVFETGEHNGLPYFSQEYVAGGSLDRKLAGTPQPPREAARLALTLAGAVHAAHQAGVVHRDLKPANVLLTADGTPKVADFGLARRQDVPGRTARGEVLGTPLYMAPEQAAGRAQEVGPAADVYALGAILYELLTGRPPFQGATTYDTLTQVLHQEPVPPARLQPTTPRDLETVCLKCLRKEPGRRYPSAADLADDLRRFLAGEPVRARPVGPWERGWKWARRRPAWAALLAVSAAAVLTLAAVVGVYTGHLHAARRQAEAHAEQAGRERDRATAQRRRADANFRRARRAVDQMLTRVSQERLRNVPQMAPVRKQLLEEALAFYEDFAREEGDDPGVRHEAGKAYWRVGILRQELGRFADAGKAYLDSARTLAALAEAAPDGPAAYDLAVSQNSLAVLYDYTLKDKARARAAYADAQRTLEPLLARAPSAETLNLAAMVANNLGNFYKAERQYPEAEQALRKAQSLFERLDRAHPDEPSYRYRLAATLGNLGALYHEGKGDLAGAEELLVRATALHRQLAEAHPAAEELKNGLARAQLNLGRVYRSEEKLAEAEAAFTGARALWEELAARQPTSVTYRHALAIALNNLGVVYRARAKPGQAREAYRKALGVYAELLRLAPGAPGYRNGQADCHGNLGNLDFDEEQWGPAEAAYRQAVGIRKELLEKQPADAQVREKLADDYRKVGLALRHRRRLAEAAAAFEESRKLRPRDPEALYDVAVELALCVPLVGDGKPGLTADERQERQRYADQALEALRQAVVSGFGKPDRLRDEPAFAPLRSRADFRALAEGLGRKGAPPRK